MQGTPKGIQNLIDLVAEKSKNDTLTKMFNECIVNTWQNTIQKLEDDSYFIVTGDIPAMWLRDSAMQIWPYIRALEDKEIATMFRGIIQKQAFYINCDSYANAFNESENSKTWDSTDKTNFSTKWNWERKYELDSICFPLVIAEKYAVSTGDWTAFTDVCKTAYCKILETMEIEQEHEAKSEYFFIRDTELITETLQRDGKGTSVAETGMVWSGFRPSDDACTYGYLVPSNMLACVALKALININKNVWADKDIEKRATKLYKDIQNGINKYAIVEKNNVEIFAYEVDGLGNSLLIDDANYPSLLSAPFFGYCDLNDETYIKTRKFILSEENKYYYKGKVAQGIGSAHTQEGYIWHLSLAMQGLTSADKKERLSLLNTLLNTHGGKFLMHEGFDANDDTQYTRDWFSWANAMFCEFVLNLIENGDM